MQNQIIVCRCVEKMLVSCRSFARCLRLIAFLFSGSAFVSTLAAAELPPVTGVSFDGQIITWAAQDGAVGYNVHTANRYLATVTEGTAFVPDSAGRYTIVAFDDNGNFSPFVFARENIVTVNNVPQNLPAPQNVVGTTYSSTAGGISWDRDPLRDLTYSVSLDNVLLGTTQGNSFWVDTLLENTENLISVSSVSTGGISSASVTLLFDTSAAEFPIPALSIDSTGNVEAPRNASAIVYSASLGELFWERAQASENIVTTEIFRDGVFVSSVAGNSFVDFNTDFSVSHVYELVAVNDLGLRSVPTVVNTNSFFDAYNELFLPALEGIDEVVNVAPIQFGFTGIESVLSGSVPFGMTVVSSDSVDVNGQTVLRTNLACTSGSLTYQSTGIPVGVTDFQFDNCLFRENTLNGSVVVTITGDPETFFTDDFPDGLAGNLDFVSSFNYSEFRIEGDNTTVELNGERIENTALTDELTACGTTYNDFNYSIVPLDDGSTVSTEVTLTQNTAFSTEAVGDSSTFSTRFSVVAPWTDGRLVEAQTTETFSGVNDPFGGGRLFYSTGTLFTESDNGDLLTLFAGAMGPISRWFAEATTELGTNTAFDDWGQLIDLPRLDQFDCEF